MKKLMTIRLIILVSIMSLAALSSLCAEIIVLKSGRSVSGKMIERTGEYIKIDFEGTPITYFYDDIERIKLDEAEFRRVESEKAAFVKIAGDAVSYISSKQFDKVEEIYKEGLKQLPNNSLLWAARAGNVLDQGKVEEATEYCNRALSLNSSCAEAYFVMGLIYAKKQNEDKAIDYFKEAIRCDPSFAMAYYDLGVSYFVKRKFTEAVDSWIKATQLDKKDEIQQKIEGGINLYIQSASTDKIIIRKVAEIPWVIMPDIEITQKKIFESVLLEYKTKLQAKGKPDYVYYMNLGGIYYYYRGEFEDSLKDVNTALDMLRNDTGVSEGEKRKYTQYMHRLLGDIYLTFFVFDSAEQNYQKALAMEPNDRNSLCGLALIQTVKGNFKEARKIYRNLLASDKDNKFIQEALRLLDKYKK